MIATGFVIPNQVDKIDVIGNPLNAMSLKNKIGTLWQSHSPYLMAFGYGLIMFCLMVLKHNAFNTRVYDFARFSQAIWNTPANGFLFESIIYRSILGDHFSPIMALASPILHLFPNERILFLIQVVNVVVASLLLYLIFQDKRPKLAPWFLLAIFLNPALHEVTLFEFRRIVFALPFLALALYALSKHNRWLMLVGLLLALLAKEEIGFFVFMIGLYLIIFERDWKWGLALMILGASWVVIISVWIIPLIKKPDAQGVVYPQLYYFSYLGNSYDEIVQAVLANPLAAIRPLFQPTQLSAVFRILLPLGLVLPFLEPRWLLFILPYLFILLLSSDEDMIQIAKWYPATILIVFFGGISVGWPRIPKKWERWVMAGFVACALLGYFLYSPAPLGGRYDPELYRIDEHDRLATKILAAIPPEARVASQPAFIPHLTLRADLYHYPWSRIGLDNIDYFVFSRQSEPYPLNKEQMNAEITAMITNPTNVVVAEADEIYLLQPGGQPLAAFPVDRTAEDWLHLDRVEVAARADFELFQNITTSPIPVKRGQQLRVTLYWKALAETGLERSVSVRLVDPTAGLIDQRDSMPVGGTRPTSWWQADDTLRDVYYLTVPADAPLGTLNLDLVVYDTYTLEVVPFEGVGDILTLHPVFVEE
jgi:uncharacterized membrane protein